MSGPGSSHLDSLRAFACLLDASDHFNDGAVGAVNERVSSSSPTTAALCDSQAAGLDDRITSKISKKQNDNHNHSR